MKFHFLKSMIALLLIGCLPLWAVTDEAEWSPEKNRLLGGGLCIMALLVYGASKVTGNLEPEVEIQGSWVCAPDYQALNNFNAGLAVFGLQGAYYLLKGLAGYGQVAQDVTVGMERG